MADRISTDFSTMKHTNLWGLTNAVAVCLKTNPKYAKSPVSGDELSALAENYMSAIVESRDGSRTVRAQRDSLKAQVIAALQQVAAYVQVHSDGDLSGTGFVTYTPTRKKPQPVDIPTLRRLYTAAVSGAIMILINAVKYARSYQLQYAALKDGVPGPWTVLDVMNVKSAFEVSGLTPGTVYAFQVRALGPRDKSEWSASYIRMCV